MAIADFVFVAVGVRDLAAADATLADVLARSATPGASPLDAVSVGRKASGEWRFHRESPAAGIAGTSVSLAAGLAAALFPSVGADQPASRAAERAVLAAVAGRVAGALGRSQLLELGELLDASAAAVIVAVPSADDEAVLNAPRRGRPHVRRNRSGRRRCRPTTCGRERPLNGVTSAARAGRRRYSTM